MTENNKVNIETALAINRNSSVKYGIILKMYMAKDGKDRVERPIIYMFDSMLERENFITAKFDLLKTIPNEIATITLPSTSLEKFTIQCTCKPSGCLLNGFDLSTIELKRVQALR